MLVAAHHGSCKLKRLIYNGSGGFLRKCCRVQRSSATEACCNLVYGLEMLSHSQGWRPGFMVVLGIFSCTRHAMMVFSVRQQSASTSSLVNMCSERQQEKTFGSNRRLDS